MLPLYLFSCRLKVVLPLPEMRAFDGEFSVLPQKDRSVVGANMFNGRFGVVNLDGRTFATLIDILECCRQD